MNTIIVNAINGNHLLQFDYPDRNNPFLMTTRIVDPKVYGIKEENGFPIVYGKNNTQSNPKRFDVSKMKNINAISNTNSKGYSYPPISKWKVIYAQK